MTDVCEKAEPISLSAKAGVKSGYSHPELENSVNGVRNGRFHTPKFTRFLSIYPYPRIPHLTGER